MKEKNITQNDVAKRAGVTRSMVSYVLNGTNRSVAPATREKILNAIEELGYRPNKYAQALLTGEEALAKKHIGVILYSDEIFLRPYYTEILSGIYTAAHKASYHVRFIRFFNELKDPILFNSLIHMKEISGLLLLAVDQALKTPEDRNILQKVSERIKQIVCIDWKEEGLSSVLFDRQEAAYKAVQCLLSKGYTDIAYIGQLDERVRGFRQAFLENNCTSIPQLRISGALDMASGYASVKQLFCGHTDDMPALPRAICAGSDEIAVGILKFLHERTIKVPAEVALISIDNLEISEYTYPPLTTVNVQKKSMGERAVEMLVKKNAYTGANAISVVLPTAVIKRASC